MAETNQQEKQWQRDLKAGKGEKGLLGALKGGKETLDTLKKNLLNKHELGLIGSIVFSILLAHAIFLDGTDVSSGGLLTYLGIGILKGLQTVITFIGILIVTGDPIRALLSRRMAMNLLVAIPEMTFGINMLPLHTAVIVITVIDLKTNFLSLKKYLTPGKAKQSLKKALEEE